MVKIFENNVTLAYPWDIATLAFWRKYPDPRVGHVKEVDTFHRSLNSETGELTTYRLIACETALPGWVAALAGGTTRAYTLEQTVANPHTKTMTVRSRNVTGASVVMIDETCVYTQDELNPTCTKYRQVAHIKGNLYGARSALEQFAHSDMITKSATGIKVVEDICHRLSTHGVQGLFEHLTNRPKMAFALVGGAEPAPSAQ